MTVLFLLHSTSMAEGSVMSFLALAKGLHSRGTTVVVVAPDGGGVCRQLRQTGIEVNVMPLHLDIYPVLDRKLNYLCFLPLTLWTLICNAWCYMRLCRLVERLKPDIIHTNTSMMRVGFYVARHCHTPHIYHIREYGDRDFSMHHLPGRRAYRATLDSTLCHDICITRDIQRYHGRSGCPRSRVIYNGIMSKDTKTTHSGAGDYFLYVGRVEPQKGLHLLAEAYAEYLKKTSTPLPLMVAGSIADRHYWQQIADTFSQHHASHLLKHLGQRDDVPQLMSRARAVVVTSQNEAFGRVMAEAMFCGCPVIACDRAGSHEQIANGRQACGTDIALSFITASELCDRLTTATERPQELEHMAESAATTVRRLYSMETSVEQVSRFYDDITKQHRQHQ